MSDLRSAAPLPPIPVQFIEIQCDAAVPMARDFDLKWSRMKREKQHRRLWVVDGLTERSPGQIRFIEDSGLMRQLNSQAPPNATCLLYRFVPTSRKSSQAAAPPIPPPGRPRYRHLKRGQTLSLVQLFKPRTADSGATEQRMRRVVEVMLGRGSIHCNKASNGPTGMVVVKFFDSVGGA